MNADVNDSRDEAISCMMLNKDVVLIVSVLTDERFKTKLIDRLEREWDSYTPGVVYVVSINGSGWLSSEFLKPFDLDE